MASPSAAAAIDSSASPSASIHINGFFTLGSSSASTTGFGGGGAWMQICAKLPPAAFRVSRPGLTASTPAWHSFANGASSDGIRSTSGSVESMPAFRLAVTSTANGLRSSEGTGKSGSSCRCCRTCEARRAMRSGFGASWPALGGGGLRASSCCPNIKSVSTAHAPTRTPPIVKPAGLLAT